MPLLIVPPERCQSDDEGEDEQIEAGGEIEGESVADDIPHVASGKGVTLAVDQHKHYFGGNEYHCCQQVYLS